MHGDVFAARRLELKPAARVEGNLHYSFLELATGAEVNGQMLRDQTDKLEESARKLAGPGKPIPPLEQS